VAAPNYTVRSFDLSVGRTSPVPILDVGTEYNGVVVISVPAGSAPAIAFGANRDAIPVATGDSWDVETVDDQGCPAPANEGLFLTNPVSGGNLVLEISLGPIGVAKI
jgi:hypothetical protein